jgi:hypothetical protein
MMTHSLKGLRTSHQGPGVERSCLQVQTWTLVLYLGEKFWTDPACLTLPKIMQNKHSLLPRTSLATNHQFFSHATLLIAPEYDITGILILGQIFLFL